MYVGLKGVQCTWYTLKMVQKKKCVCGGKVGDADRARGRVNGEKGGWKEWIVKQVGQNVNNRWIQVEVHGNSSYYSCNFSENLNYIKTKVSP